MKVLSLFDGISCGRLALERAGIPVTRYVAYEIDKHAIEVSRWNWNDIEHCGSVENADFTQYEGFDVVMGGFPCTDLSINKRDREGLAGKNSRLFWEQVRAIKEVKPKYFLVENNYGMPKADERIITETLGVAPVLINSALVSAQNRRRLYWTNIGEISQPADKGIRLADVLQTKPGLKYNLTEKGIATMLEANVAYNRVSRLRDHAALKTSAIVSQGAVPNNVLAVPAKYYYSLEALELMSKVRQDGLVVRNGIMQYKGREVPVKLPDGEYVMRRLTPTECERLQTLPDGYTEIVSDTQRYKQLGNGWTVDVIAHILGHIDDHLL